MSTEKAFTMKNVYLGDGPMAVAQAQESKSHGVSVVSNLLESARTVQPAATERGVSPTFSRGSPPSTVTADRLSSRSMNSAATSHHMPASMVSRRAFQTLFRS
jgi:hypothetical protein